MVYVSLGITMHAVSQHRSSGQLAEGRGSDRRTCERKAALPISNNVGVSALPRDIISAALSAEMHSMRRVQRLHTRVNQVL